MSIILQERSFGIIGQERNDISYGNKIQEISTISNSIESESETVK
jgi:hypothetical protein